MKICIPDLSALRPAAQQFIAEALARPAVIAFYGKMGAGKTTIGKKLAKALGCEFIDTDELLEVTPKSLRIRKKILDPLMRKRANRNN